MDRERCRHHPEEADQHIGCPKKSSDPASAPNLRPACRTSYPRVPHVQRHTVGGNSSTQTASRDEHVEVRCLRNRSVASRYGCRSNPIQE